MYDISGSAHFINKCDNGIVIHRNRDLNAGPVDIVQVLLSLSLSCFICFFYKYLLLYLLGLGFIAQ
jgi:hypothetical protein